MPNPDFPTRLRELLDEDAAYPVQHSMRGSTVDTFLRDHAPAILALCEAAKWQPVPTEMLTKALRALNGE